VISRHRWWGLLLLVLLVGAALRVYRLELPAQPYFDEIYYVGGARDYLTGRADENSVHPPLGKELMALALQGAGDSPIGWRLIACLSGLSTLGLAAALGWVLTRRSRVAVLSAALLSLDFLHLVQSRIAMLDPIQNFFIQCGLLATAVAITRNDSSNKGTDPSSASANSSIDNSSARPGKLIGDSSLAPICDRSFAWDIIAGICFGCATACKWNGLFAAGAAFLAMAWTGVSPRRLARTAVVYAGLIAAVYVLSYLPLMAREGPDFELIRAQHQRMLSFRYDPEQFKHRYLSPFYSWPLALRPVWFYFNEEGGTVQGVVAMGMPLFWWLAVYLLGETLISPQRRRQPALRFLAVAILAQWLPWAVGTTGGFLYYMLPITPLMAVLVARELDDWWEEPLSRALAIAYLLLLTVTLILYFPFLTALPVSRAYFDRLFFLPWWI